MFSYFTNLVVYGCLFNLLIASTGLLVYGVKNYKNLLEPLQGEESNYTVFDVNK